MDIFFYLIFRIVAQFTFGIYVAFLWIKMTFIGLSWLGADLFFTILLGVALLHAMSLFRHILLESRTSLKAPSEFTFQESLRALAIAAGLAVFTVVFICAIFPISLKFKISGLEDVLLFSTLTFWFLLPLVAYAVLYVRDRNRVLNPGNDKSRA